MAFTVREFRDLIRILGEHPEWRDELRRQVLTDELPALPQLMRDLTDQVRSLADAQARTERQVEELAAAHRQSQQEVRALAEAMQTLTVDAGRLKDFGLETQFERKAPAYLGCLLRGT